MSGAIDARRPSKGAEWRPAEPIAPPALFSWPPSPRATLKWLFGAYGFIWPWNTFYVAIAVVTYLFLTPAIGRMTHFEIGWIAIILGRNMLMLSLLVGAWHLRLYTQKAQSLDYKYNGRWLAKGNAFWFKNQVFDNIFWNLISAVPIWTACEVVTLWAQANHYIPTVTWRAHPIYCALLMIFIVFFREVHFYLIHRLLHTKLFYRWVHSLHHANVFPGPWSGLAMHPIEHLIYFSSILVLWVVPSSPLHVIFCLQQSAFTPSQGHSGFHKVVVGSNEFENANLMHYLHHRYFEVNYGGDGLVPLDKWVGTYHDGSDEAHEAMNKRILARTTAAQRDAAN